MSVTVKQLRDLLSRYGPDNEIVDTQGRSFCHVCTRSDNKITISVDKPLGYCKNCGEYVYPERENSEYKGICPVCDENKYDFEIEALEPEREEVYRPTKEL